MRAAVGAGLSILLGCAALEPADAAPVEEPEEIETRAPSRPRSENAPSDRASAGTIERVVGEARGDAKWKARADVDSAVAAVELWEQAAIDQPEHPRLLVKLTRAHVFLADAASDQQDELSRLDTAIAWGERALLAADPELAARLESGEKLADALREADEAAVPALYWYAVALSKWSRIKGFAVTLGHKDAVLAAMRRCADLDPEYHWGGPLRYLGVYYALMPAFAGGDLDKARAYFEQAAGVAPKYVGIPLARAQFLDVKLQDRADFEAQLRSVLDTPDDAIPELEPETRALKLRAQKLLDEVDELF